MANEELEQYAAAARKRAFARHPERVHKPPKCGRCDDSGWEPITRDQKTVKRCRNGCEIPQAAHLKRRVVEERKDDF